MALFDHTEKSIDLPLDVNKEKRLSRLLGTNSLLNNIRKLQGRELGNFRVGCIVLIFSSGLLTYYYYRNYYKQRMLSGWALHRLTAEKPIDAGNQFMYPNIKSFSLYYRMPRKEFEVLYRMKPAFIVGEFDHTKEILLPKRKDGVDGYQVITPFYYYMHEQNPDRFKGLSSDGSNNFTTYVKERAALAVDRGWIPAGLKDRRLRPNDINKGLERLYGTIKFPDIDRHDFTIPNDPTYNHWRNFSLEDFAIYWQLPNIRDASYCYFQEVNFGGLAPSKPDVYPVLPNLQQTIVQDQVENGFRMDKNFQARTYLTGSLTAFFTYLLYLAA